MEGVAYSKDAQPYIQWNHIDGPLLYLRCGKLHWLTYWERFKFAAGWTDIYKLERENWNKP